MHGKLLLSQAQIDVWNENGYLVLRQAIGQRETGMARRVVDQQRRQRDGNNHEVDITSGPDEGKIFKLRGAKPSHRNYLAKLNNLFMHVPDIRAVCYAPVIRAALIDLLEGGPLICNSLNFERGSEQPFHFDTWYMPPPAAGRMVAASIALEPVDEQNGPFIYYPGSHKIPAWRFSDGRLNHKADEAGDMMDYVGRQLKRRGLRAETFSGQDSDVFLWHAQLFHGGAPIANQARTRASLVVHYWRSGDLPQERVRHDAHGAYISRTLRGELSAEAS